MRFTAAAAATMVGAASAAWSPDMGSHGPPSYGGEHPAPPSNGTGAGWGPDSYTTEVVTAYTTFCPAATEITHGGQTYTATEATTLTITNCEEGCTVTKPVTSAPAETTPYSPVETTETSEVMTSVSIETTVSPVPMPSVPASSPAAPVPVYPTGGNGTAPAPVPSGTGAPTSATEGSPIPEQTGNAASRYSASAAGLLAIFGLVAAL